MAVKFLKDFCGSNTALLAYRILLVYLALAVCRVVFWLYNADKLGAIHGEELWGLLYGALKFDTVSVIYANGVFILMSLLPGRFRKHGWWRSSMFVVFVLCNFCALALNFADVIYFHYTSKRVTSEEIFFMNNGNSLRLMLKFASENLLLVFGCIALIVTMAWAYRVRRVPHNPIKNAWARWVVEIVLLLVTMVVCVAGVRGGWTIAIRPITLSNATAYTSDVKKANLILSNPFCVIRTIGTPAIPYEEFYPLDSLAKIYTPYHYPKADETPQVSLKGRNVVIMVLESFSAEHSAYLTPELYPDGVGYTPFLDSLMREGYTFTRAYANGHKSIEALPSIVSSIPSFYAPFVLQPQSLAPSRPLPAILSDQGYHTMFFCGSERGSMGFDAYMSLAGVKEQWWREEFESKRGGSHFDGYWGVWDHQMIDFAGEIMNSTPEPFFSTQFTLSSHHPFVVPDEYRKSLPKGQTKVHPCIAYVDNSIRKFFEKYSKEEWFDRTLFVFVADHVSSEKYSEEANSPLGSSRIIQFFYTPDGALRGTDNQVAQQIDIMPTLLHLLENKEPFFAYGHNLFVENQDVMTFYWSTAALCYVSTNGEWTVLFDGKDIVALYAASDKCMLNPLDLDEYAEVVSYFEYRLRAMTQSYFYHLKSMNYLVPQVDSVAVGEF